MNILIENQPELIKELYLYINRNYYGFTLFYYLLKILYTFILFVKFIHIKFIIHYVKKK